MSSQDSWSDVSSLNRARGWSFSSWTTQNCISSLLSSSGEIFCLISLPVSCSDQSFSFWLKSRDRDSGLGYLLHKYCNKGQSWGKQGACLHVKKKSEMQEHYPSVDVNSSIRRHWCLLCSFQDGCSIEMPYEEVACLNTSCPQLIRTTHLLLVW